jgi:hypothetical protein
MSDSQPMGTRAHVTRAVAAIVLVATAALAAPVLHDEWISARLEAGVAQDLGGLKPLPWAMGGDVGLCHAACPPRALAATGVRLTFKGARETSMPLRHATLVEAKQKLNAALAVRPFSGGWWTWLAYARSLDEMDSTKTFEALTRSYEAAPFLPVEGVWRVGFAASNWELLGPVLRNRVIDEAIWMRDVDPENAAKVFAAFQSPGAAEALRLGMMRPRSKIIPHRRSGGPG